MLDHVVGGKYRVLRKIGEGGMSVIYEAQHVKLKRSVAIKRLAPALLDNADAMRRFEREADLLAGLNHPNVVEICDWEMLPDGAPCMVLEYLHGAHLGVRLSRGPMPWEAIAKIGDQTMSAVALAHRTGITHRDLKPANIFIAIDDSGEESVKLLDFGVSKLRGVGTMTGMFAMLGTPSYMSPEQASGNSDAIGPSTDVWAMGAILYEMATGRLAFQGDTFAATIMQIATGAPEPLTSLRPDAPVAFVNLIDRALAHDAERRIQTIEDLRGGLRAALEPRTNPRVSQVAIPKLAPTAQPAHRTQQRPVTHVSATDETRVSISRRMLWIAGAAAAAVTVGSLVLALVT
jgi:serine/threonine protein kinase